MNWNRCFAISFSIAIACTICLPTSSHALSAGLQTTTATGTIVEGYADAKGTSIECILASIQCALALANAATQCERHGLDSPECVVATANAAQACAPLADCNVAQ